jgi:LacI family transcriptional regulator
MKSAGLKPATLKDVARLAGVSTATVARVIHERGYVSNETRAVVSAAIAETGYQLNAVAQGLRRQRSFVLGHVMLSVSPNPFFAGIALGVDLEAATRQCAVLMINTNEDLVMERRAVETLIRRRVDAILFTTLRDLDHLRMVSQANIPAVQVERISDPTGHGVTVDNYRGAYDAVDYLIRLGHRRIAFIGESPEIVSGGRSREVERERLSGYRDALNLGNIGYDESIVELSGTYFDLEHTRQATSRLLDLQEPPTAIFAVCDAMAAAVLQEVYRRGLRVPADISVIGYDDTTAMYLSPPLTTVEQPMVEIGRAAADMAFEVLEEQSSMPRVDGAHSLGKRRRLEARLIVRDSTGPPPI